MDWFPQPYEDETLYSIIARLWHYLGRPRSSVVNRAVVGRRSWAPLSRLPVQLDGFLRHPAWTRRDVDRLIDEHTLFPFYTAFVGSEVRTKVRRSMYVAGAGPQKLLGLGSFGIPEPQFLRFCPSCSHKMMETAGERWWQRIHQLPGIEVCAVHGEWLVDSSVNARLGRDQVLRIPDEVTCQSSAGHDPATGGKVPERLRELANAATALLREPSPAAEARDLLDQLKTKLKTKGFTRGGRMTRHTQLRSFMGDYWGDVLDIVPGLAVNRPPLEVDWLTAQLTSSTMRFHPLRHLVVVVALDSLPSTERPFGDGPWPCLNPLAKHHRRLAVTRCRRQAVRDGIRGRFICSCGYSYARTLRNDGSITSPRISDFGPSLVPHIYAGRKQGLTVTEMARAVGLQPAVLVNQARHLGIQLRHAG